MADKTLEEKVNILWNLHMFAMVTILILIILFLFKHKG